MGSSFSVSTIFLGKDRMSPVFKKMGKSASAFGGHLKAILVSGVIKNGLTLLRNGIQTVSNEFVSFDNAVKAASGKFKDLDLTTQSGIATLEMLKNTAREVGGNVEFTATQAAEGLDFLALAGFNANQAMASLPGTVDLATVAQSDLARATDIASDTLGSFGLMTEDTTQLQLNFARSNDILAKTSTTANTSIEDLFESIKKGGPSFTAAGQSMETFSALAGKMANAGVKGSESGTILRNMMLRLAKPTDVAAGVLENLGIVTRDSQGNFLDAIDILDQFGKATKGMGTAQKSAALSTVFGARSITGVNILLAEGTESLKSYRNELLNAGGTSKKIAGIMRDSIQNRLASLQSAAIELGFKFATALETYASNAIKMFTDIIRNVDVTPIINGIENIIQVGKQIADELLPSFMNVFNSIKNLGSVVFNTIGDIFDSITGGVGPVNGSLNIFKMILDGISFAVNVLSQAIIFISPILTNIGKLIFMVITRVKEMSQKFISVMQAKGTFDLLGKTVSAVGRIFGVLFDIVGKVFNFLMDVGVIEFLISVFNNVVSTINMVANVFTFLWKIVSPILDGLLFLVKILLKPLFKLFEIFTDINTVIKSFTSDVFGAIVDFFTGGKKSKKVKIESESPNRREVESRQAVNFNGRLDIAGAPPGSTFESDTEGAPPIRTEMLGISR